MNIVERHNKGRLTMDEFNKFIPVVNVIVEQMELIEDAHVGFALDGGIDEDQFNEIESYIEWVLSDFEEDEQRVIKDMVNDRMCYEPVNDETEALNGEVSRLRC
jgi:hypothetical protein